MSETTWRAAIADAADGDEIIATTLTEQELDVKFDDGYGGAEGVPFTAWSKTRVYFPVCYDGSEWVDSVPRNPCDDPSSHVGGY